LIAIFNQCRLRVGTIKHDVHGFSIDKPGKDSHRHKAAGAYASVITSPSQIGMVTDVDHDHSPEELVTMLPQVDIVLAEGFKRSHLPKIEVYRPETGMEAACKGDPHLIAVVSDADLDWGVRQFKPSDTKALAIYLLRYCGLSLPDNQAFQVASQLGST
jgi:molybdopterin-guanine dinucleotide biosynthesis protein B